MGIDGFISKVEQSLEKLVTLNVVTAVGTPNVESVGTGAGAETRFSFDKNNKAKLIWTSIDLAQGDITTVMDPDFQGEAGKELREFHKSRETQGLEIIRHNISALKELIGVLDAAYQHRKQSNG